MRKKNGLALCRKSSPVFERGKRILDPPIVVQADVVVDHRKELLDGVALPVPRIEQVVFEATKEALAHCVVTR
jgi:hypothetical protein